jgi:cytochrome c peroxidase
MTSRRSLKWTVSCAVVAWLLSGAAWAQAVAPSTLTVAGDVSAPLSLTPADLKGMPRTRVEMKEDGRTVVYEGVLVGEILKRAGAPVGADLRGNALATYVLASASDGYQVAFSLGELDPALTANDIIVADTIDGKPLFDYQGPFRIVVPKDSKAARSIRMLQRLDVVRLKSYAWTLPTGFPTPDVPAGNPMSDAKAELGRYLFYDVRLSGNGTQSCASCHEQRFAFTDGRAVSVGSTGQLHPRGSMSLVNVAYAKVLTWADPALTRLEDQALVPMYGDHPIELGLGRSDAWLGALQRDEKYRRLFGLAFGDRPDPFTRDHVVNAITTFERTIVSARSPFDRYHFERDDQAVSAAAKRGEVLFHSRPFSCFTCHGGVNFSGGTSGEFKAPTLRNIAVTAPYMHDGKVATLDSAITHNVPDLVLTVAQRADLLAFLQSLTDDELLRDPRFSSPF